MDRLTARAAVVYLEMAKYAAHWLLISRWAVCGRVGRLANGAGWERGDDGLSNRLAVGGSFHGASRAQLL